MCHRGLGKTAVSFLVVVVACANPIVIRSGVVKSEGQKQDSDAYGVSHHKGIANFEAADGFNGGSEKKHTSSGDSGRYGEEIGDRKNHLDETSYGGGSFHQNGGGDVSDLTDKRAHKKGHRKSGFQNSYHKDERGSNSSFFDDADDEGDEYVYKTHKGTYGDAENDSRRGVHSDASRASKEGARRGQYDSSDRYDQDQANRRAFNRNRYDDNREEGNRRNAANAYGLGGRYAEDRYVERPYGGPYGGPYRRDYDHNRYEDYPKRHITVYEDPRYEQGLPYGSYGHGDDYVEIDVRPAIREVYRDRRPSYDYY